MSEAATTFTIFALSGSAWKYIAFGAIALLLVFVLLVAFGYLLDRERDEPLVELLASLGRFLQWVANEKNRRSPIDNKYIQLGGRDSFLGRPLHGEHSCPDGVGRYREFKRGSIHWHPSTGAHETHGAIKTKWARMQFELGPLGYPISDERNISQAELADLLAPGRDAALAAKSANRCSEFQHGRIFCWSPDNHRYFMTVITADGARTDDEHKHGK